MITEIIKRDGRSKAFKQEKIVHAIFKAATACGGLDYERAEEIGRQVGEELKKNFWISNRMWNQSRLIE